MTARLTQDRLIRPLSNHRGEKCDFWDRQFDKVLASYATGTLADVPPNARTLHFGA